MTDLFLDVTTGFLLMLRHQKRGRVIIDSLGEKKIIIRVSRFTNHVLFIGDQHWTPTPFVWKKWSLLTGAKFNPDDLEEHLCE